MRSVRSVAPMQVAKVGYIVLSAALCLLGVLLLTFPEALSRVVGLVCGILFILFGCVKLVGYFSKDLYRLAFQYDLAFGILLIVLGVVMLCHPSGVMTLLCVGMGISILADGLFKLQIAGEAKRFGIPAWWLILSLAVVTAACGLGLLLCPGQGTKLLLVLLGLALLLEGILNFCTVLAAVKIVRNQKPDVIEVEYREERED